ncbi:MAG: adenosine kinase [Gammaproteobacteria bacterium]|nr:adenosine kinase [Gammaproteobacteria bacterium]
MQRFDVYGLGAALVDTELRVTDAELRAHGIEKGVMTLVDEPRQNQLLDVFGDHLTLARRASGGSGANTVIAVSCFGGRGYYSCRVADDDNGHFYLHDLATAGVTHNGTTGLPAGTTGKCLVLITPDAERTMNTFLGISESLAPENLDPEALAAATYLYIEGYLATSPSGRAAAIRARELARQHGTRVALSLSDPGIVAHFGSELRAMAGGRVDLLFCNGDEARGWTGADDVETAAERLQADAESFAITLGARGALVFDGRQLHRIPATPATAVDTNGAGDMFAGAFLYGLTQGFDHVAAGRFANLAAAAVVAQYGPRLAPAQHADLLQQFRAAVRG